jgi:hypothetical protein
MQPPPLVTIPRSSWPGLLTTVLAMQSEIVQDVPVTALGTHRRRVRTLRCAGAANPVPHPSFRRVTRLKFFEQADQGY